MAKRRRSHFKSSIRRPQGQKKEGRWINLSNYDFSVKNRPAGLIFCAFSCKLKSNHVRAVSHRKNDGFDMTCRIKFSKNNGE